MDAKKVDQETPPDQEWLNQIARRASALLKKEPAPRQQMSWAEDHLFKAGLWLGDVEEKAPAPASWTAQVIAQNRELVDRSLPYLQNKGLHPEEAENFESLVRQLVPKEGGL
jgi:hypothetical protein